MNAAKPASRGLGLAVTVPDEVARGAAIAAQENGYHSFWLNNPPGADALGRLGGVAPVATTIWLGVGVIPLSHHRPDEIVQEVRQNKMPLDRFYLGIGSGGGAGGVERVKEGIRAIRSQLECRLVVAALGPRMCRLAGEAADAVLFNWLTPEFTRRSIGWVREGAESAGRSGPRLMAYVRVALGDEAMTRLQREAGNYESIPQYAAHFQRMGTPAMGTAISGGTEREIRQGLAAWDEIVDEVVVRAITARDTLEEVNQLLEAARPEPSS